MQTTNKSIFAPQRIQFSGQLKPWRTLTRFAASALAVGLLVSCGGGSSGGDAQIEGRVADGYLRGAIVFWDCNDNFTLDAGEVNTISLSGGKYSIAAQPSASCHLTAHVPSSAIDEDTNQQVSAAMLMRAVNGKPEFISPLSTLVAIGANSEAELMAMFPANPAMNASDDYIAAGQKGVAHHNVARYMAASLQAIAGVITTDQVAARDQLKANLRKVPAATFTSASLLPQTSIDGFRDTLVASAEEYRIGPQFVKYEIDQDRFATLNAAQKSAVLQAFAAYTEYREEITQGANIDWALLPRQARAPLKQLFTAHFPDPSNVAQLVSDRDTFLRGKSGDIQEALNNFDVSLTAKLIDGVIDTSATYFDGVVSVAPLASTKYLIAAVPLKFPAKSSKVRTLRKNLDIAIEASKLPRFAIGCIGPALTILNDMAEDFRKESGVYVDAPKLFDAVVCLTDLVSSDIFKDTVKAVSTTIKAGKVISENDLLTLALGIALCEVTLTSLDILGVGESPGGTQAVGATKIFLAGAKAFKLYADMGNTNDATGLAFKKALTDIGKEVDNYLDLYAGKAFNGRVMPYFKRVDIYKVEASTTVTQPLSTAVRVTLSVAEEVNVPYSVQWFFGDGTTKTGNNAQHTYSSLGSYSVTAYIMSGTELAIKVYESGINVVCAPNESFSAAEGCYLARSVIAIQPASAPLAQTKVFTITGTNFPDTVVASIADASCGSSYNVTTLSFQISCKLAGTTGAKTVTVKTNSDANNGIVIDSTKAVTATIALTGVAHPTNGFRYEVISCASWAACKTAAQAKGAQLVTISSADLNAWLLDTFRSQASNANGFWIGLNQGTLGLTWASGQAVSYTNWNVGEPNNQASGAIMGNTGAHMYTSSFGTGVAGKWNDTSLAIGSGATSQAIIEYAP